MATAKIVRTGTALKVCSFVEEVEPNGRVVITVSDADGNPECNGFGATKLDAIKDLNDKGYQIVVHEDRRQGRKWIIWKTHNP